jgi:hypothetical protein
MNVVMNKTEAKEIRKKFVKGNTAELRMQKLEMDIFNIAFHKVIPSPFAKYNKDYQNEVFSSYVKYFNIMTKIASEKNLQTIINTNDYCLYSHRYKEFVNAINLIINRLKNNCNYIVVNNIDNHKKELDCLYKCGIIANTNLVGVYIINHNFIYRGISYFVDYLYTLNYSKDINIVENNKTTNYINLGSYFTKDDIQLSKCYYDDSILKSKYDKFLIKENDTKEYRIKLADAYIKYYDINLICPNIEFII